MHALLDHLDVAGFTGAPRPLGVDAAGREVLTWMPGETVGSRVPWPAWVHSEGALVQVARWLARYHDAVAGFVPPEGAVWRSGRAWEPGLVIGHNDIQPGNAAWEDGRLTGFFDWEWASPVTREEDLAVALFSWVPFTVGRAAAATGAAGVSGRGRRLRLFLDAYGFDGDVARLLATTAARMRSSAEGIRRGASEGDAALAAYAGRGVPRELEEGAARLEADAPRLVAEVAGERRAPEAHAEPEAPAAPDGPEARDEPAAPEALVRLVAELGDAVAAGEAELEPTRSDRSGWRTDERPLALVTARSVADVQATLRIATATRTPVVPRGAGTGLAGGAIGTAGAIVLDVSRMDRVLEISPADELAVIEPGVVNDDLNRALAEHGLWFAPDPASKAISSVGGNIATNAGGLLCAKYGVTREAVLALDVVLADGELISTGHRTVKGVTGYDLTALMTGSEGTLGVIVGATVRVRPIPPVPATIGGLFPDVTSAAAASAAVTASRVAPAVMELLDALSIRRIAELLGEDVVREAMGTTGSEAQDAGAFLLVQVEGGEEVAAGVAALLAEHGGAVARARDAEHGEQLLAIRRAFHPALAAHGEVLVEDVAVPRSRLPEMFRAIERISRDTGIDIPTVAHAADGNLHPNFVYTGDVVPEAVWDAASELFRTAIALGGTLTGEHGVGLLKRRWLGDEIGERSLALQRGIKAVFDPLGILNPGKVFEV